MGATHNLAAAIIAVLSADNGAGGVVTLLPDGVWFGTAPAGKTRFVVIDEVASHDEAGFQTRAWESVVYRVKAVHQSSSMATVAAAAARINALLDYQALSATGYAEAWAERIEHVQYQEVGEQESDLRWQHCGGLYEVFAN